MYLVQKINVFDKFHSGMICSAVDCKFGVNEYCVPDCYSKADTAIKPKSHKVFGVPAHLKVMFIMQTMKLQFESLLVLVTVDREKALYFIIN